MDKIELLDCLSEYLNDYLPFGKGLSANTVTSYRVAFQLLFEFLYKNKRIKPERVTFESLSGDAVTEFLYWLESNRGCSAKTRNHRRTALLSFASFAMKKNIAVGSAFYAALKNTPKRKVPKNTDIRYFTRDEVGILLGLPDASTKIGYRNKVLLAVLYATGARAQELCDIKVNDVRFGKPTSVKLNGKGNKSRVVTIPENCSLLLKGYMNSNRMLDANANLDPLRYIFPSQINSHMSVSCVEEITKKYLAIAKASHPELFPAKSYSPHSFRHSVAVHMLESGIPLPVIKTFLGHESISSTMVYAEVTPELANKYLLEHSRLTETAIPHSTVAVYSEKLPFLKKYLNPK